VFVAVVVVAAVVARKPALAPPESAFAERVDPWRCGEDGISVAHDEESTAAPNRHA